MLTVPKSRTSVVHNLDHCLQLVDVLRSLVQRAQENKE
jgi:hypothetical protein